MKILFAVLALLPAVSNAATLRFFGEKCGAFAQGSEPQVSAAIAKLDDLDYRLAHRMKDVHESLADFNAACTEYLANPSQDPSVTGALAAKGKKAAAAGAAVRKVKNELYDAYNKKLLFRKVKKAAESKPAGQPCADQIDSVSTLNLQYAEHFEKYAKRSTCKPGTTPADDPYKFIAKPKDLQ